MAIRIYALAKELKLDSKELVDICTAAGVPGKGSALASLTEEEVATVKAFMGGKKAGTAPSAPASPGSSGSLGAGLGAAGSLASGSVPAVPGVVRREDYLPPTGTLERPVPPEVKKRPARTAPTTTDSEGAPAPVSESATVPQALLPADGTGLSAPAISPESGTLVTGQSMGGPGTESTVAGTLASGASAGPGSLGLTGTERDSGVPGAGSGVATTNVVAAGSADARSGPGSAAAKPRPPLSPSPARPVPTISGREAAARESASNREAAAREAGAREGAPVLRPSGGSGVAIPTIPRAPGSGPLAGRLSGGGAPATAGGSGNAGQGAGSSVAQGTATGSAPAGSATGSGTAPVRPPLPGVNQPRVAPSGPVGNLPPPRRAMEIPLKNRGPAKGAEGGAPATPAREGGESGRRPTSRPAMAAGGMRLAPIPMGNAPPPPKIQEPEAQRPDIRLPVEALRTGKIGGQPLREHLAKQEERRRTEGDEKRPVAGGGKVLELDGPSKLGRRRFDEEQEAKERALLARKKAAGASRRRRADGEEDSSGNSRTLRRARRPQPVTSPRKGKVELELPCTIRDFSAAVGIPAAKILMQLVNKLGTKANINSQISHEMAELLSLELGVELNLRKHTEHQDAVLAELDREDEASADLQPRPPVVTFLGHVDHGKTSLLDKIIGIDNVSGESGGITQHIRAYLMDRNERRISFVDTPGHEAFTEMRARGANVTDIAVLVVAADDGVMPQTEEAISHAKAAEVPIIVALNKIDLPGVDINRVYQDLAANDLLPSEWGGEVEVVKTSATKGTGIDELLDTILTIAELHEFKANPARAGLGTCLEAQLHEGRGVECKMLVQNGTLRVGDVVLCGQAYGRVKAMYNPLDPRKTLEEAGPSVPVQVTGLNIAPNAGDKFFVLDDVSEAREIAESRAIEQRASGLGDEPQHITLENLFNRLGIDKIETLNVIIRADVRGSIEAIGKELQKLDHPEVKIKVLQRSVGGITEADIMLAHASDAIVIGFNVVPDERAREMAERHGVQVRRYDIIYKLAEDIRNALAGLLKPEERETDLGRALVQRVFTIGRVGAVAGCRVIGGVVERNARIRIIRDGRVIGEYPVETLRREKDDAKEVREGYECGIKLQNFNDIKEGDILEAYRIDSVARQL